MELMLVWIHFLFLYSDFTLSKVIETDIKPSYWKRYHEILNYPVHHKISAFPNKKSSNNIINYGFGVQRPTNIVPSTKLLSYKIMQPTIRNLNSIYDINNKKVCGKSDTKTAHNNENLQVENKNVIYDKQQNIINEHNKDIDQVLEKCPKPTEIENITFTFEEPNHAEIDIVNEKYMLETLLPQKNDSRSNFLDKLYRNKSLTKRSDEPQEHEDVTRLDKEQNKNERNDEFISKGHVSVCLFFDHDCCKAFETSGIKYQNKSAKKSEKIVLYFTERKSVNTDGIKNDEINFDDQQNTQANFWHTLYNPKGLIRYMPNQYPLSDISNNYISKLYSKTKYSNPFYDTQGRLTRHLNYGDDIRYSRPDVRY